MVVDVKALPASERAALVAILEAARVMDAIFLRQVWAGNGRLLLDLADDVTPAGRARLQAFVRNKGPWLRLDGNRPFIDGVGDKPPGANFYPPGASKDEVERWMAGLPARERATAQGFFTTIRRRPDGAFDSVPYSLEYQGELARAAASLREAAARTQQPTLRRFLEARAAAFLSNDYYDSDLAWMNLDSSLEPTIGPYETYEDGWFGFKAAFEAFVTVRDDAETARLATLSGELQDIENHLPEDPKLRNPKLGALAPIRVVNLVLCSGDALSGVLTAAFNLPNDERIIVAHGAKRTMLRNVQRAKFDKVLVPIARRALAAADRGRVAFDAFFTHILMHELVHGLGPHEGVRTALQDSYAALEEAKADAGGLWAMQFLIDKGVLDKSLERSMYVTFLASAFRSLRFGADAHARGMALQVSTLMDAGAFRVDKDGTFSIDDAKVKAAVRDLAAELLALEASRDKAKAAEVLRTRAVVRPEVRKVLDRLADVPVDIDPRFVTAQALLSERHPN
jgi:hypothetical protein